MADTLTFKARLNGDRVSQYIYTHDNLWQYQQVRLVEQLKLPMSDEEFVQQKIYTKDDKLVLEDGPPLEAPVITRRATIVVAGTTRGYIDVAASFRDTLYWTAAAALAEFLARLCRVFRGACVSAAGARPDARRAGKHSGRIWRRRTSV